MDVSYDDLGIDHVVADLNRMNQGKVFLAILNPSI